MEELSDSVRVSLTGGSYTVASVGWGKTLVAGEPKPTVPTEAAGEIFAKAMGAEASDVYGEPNQTIRVNMVIMVWKGLIQQSLPPTKTY